MNFRAMLSARMVGIDVQRDAVRLIEISRHRRAITIARTATIAVQSTVFNREMIIDDWAQLTDVISELVIMAEVRNAPTTICVPARLVEFGEITLPSWLSSFAIKFAITAQIGSHESWQIDYMRKFGRSKKESIFTYVATPQSYLNQYLHCMKSGGLKVRHVDVDRYALERALKYRPTLYMPDIASSEQDYYIAVGLALYGV
jgi:Tfp pilus assembly PilM family ATPase